MPRSSTHLLQKDNRVGCLCVRKPLQLRRNVVVALLLVEKNGQIPDAQELLQWRMSPAPLHHTAHLLQPCVQRLCKFVQAHVLHGLQDGHDIPFG